MFKASFRALSIVLAVGLALSAGACGGGTLGGKLGDIAVNGVANPISNTRFATIESAYGLALAGANTYIANYRKGNRCTVTAQESITNPCSRRSVVTAMQGGIKDAQKALGKARSLLINNPQLDPSELLDAAQAAVDALTGLVQKS